MPTLTDPGAGLLRVVRGSGLALACTAIALAGHVGGGGAALSVPALVAVTVLVGASFIVLADRRRSIPQIAAAAAGSQVAYHLAFSFAVPTPHAHPRDLAATGVDLRMLAGHVVAAGCLAWLVAGADAIVWAVYHLVGLVAVPGVEVATASGAPRACASPRAGLPRTRGHRLALANPRRGPPGVVAA